MNNAALTEEYLAIIESFGGDAQGRRDAARYMGASSAVVHDEVVASSFLPRLYDAETHEIFREAAETIYRILSKVMQRFLDDAAYRTLFSFEERLTDLILIPRRYECPLPVARVDLFLNEDTGAYEFCEFNTDGTSGMNENREITASIEQSASYREFSRFHRTSTCELFDSWIDAFMEDYATFPAKTEHPRVAICDFLEHATIEEFKVFRDRFNQRGIPCTIVDVRDLHFDGETLVDARGASIDVVWRRCIYKDVMDHWEESQAMIEAARSGKIALIGSFLGTVAHDKRIFAILHNPATKAFLTREEGAFIDQHIPMTTYLDHDHIDLSQIMREKDSWIIKPTDDNGASDVYAGIMSTSDEWSALIERFANAASGRPFLVQRFVTPFATQTMPPDDEETLDATAAEKTAMPVRQAPYNNMSGLYLYNGIFTGVFSRLGPQPIICGPYGGITAASIWVDSEA